MKFLIIFFLVGARLMASTEHIFHQYVIVVMELPLGPDGFLWKPTIFLIRSHWSILQVYFIL